MRCGVTILSLSALLLACLTAVSGHYYMPGALPSAEQIGRMNRQVASRVGRMPAQHHLQQQPRMLTTDDAEEQRATSALFDDTPTAPLAFQNWKDKTVLFVSAHPDDIEASAGGLIAQLVAQGTDVHYAIFTNGDKGCANPICLNMTSEDIAVTRAQEALNAAAVLGVPSSNVHTFDLEDSMLCSYPEQQLRQSLVRLIRTVKPNVMMSWLTYPTYSMRPADIWLDLGQPTTQICYHPDHQYSAKIACDSHLSAGLGLLWPELGPLWSIDEYYMFDFTNPTHYVDIESTIALKAQSYAAHKTQVPSPDVVLPVLEIINGRVANFTVGTKGLKYAEGFLAYF